MALSVSEEEIDLTVSFGDGSKVKILVSEFHDYKHVIAALRKIGQTDYLLSLHDALRGIEEDDDWDEDDEDEWDEDEDY